MLFRHKQASNLDCQVQRLSLQPGDRIAILAPKRLTEAQRMRIATDVASWAGDYPVAVLEDGLQPIVVGGKPTNPGKPSS